MSYPVPNQPAPIFILSHCTELWPNATPLHRNFLCPEAIKIGSKPTKGVGSPLSWPTILNASPVLINSILLSFCLMSRNSFPADTRTTTLRTRVHKRTKLPRGSWDELLHCPVLATNRADYTGVPPCPAQEWGARLWGLEGDCQQDCSAQTGFEV